MARRIAPLVLVPLALALNSCYHSYQAHRLGSGYEEIQVEHNSFRVTYTLPGTAINIEKEKRKEILELYLLYRCAELTVQRGYDYFVVWGDISIVLGGQGGASQLPITHAEERADTSTCWTCVRPCWTCEGKYRSGFTVKGRIQAYTAGRQTLTMEMFYGKRPANQRGVYDARYVLGIVPQKISEIDYYAAPAVPPP